MRCIDLDDQLSAYADGQLAQPQREALETHLASCERCRRVLTRYRQTGSILALTRDDAWAPPDLRLRIMLAARQPRQHRRSAPRPLLSACVAALVLAGVVLGGHALVPASGAMPAAPQPVATTSILPVSSAPRSGHASSVAGCPQHSISAIARCLGVSRVIVPTILLEEQGSQSSGGPLRNHLATQQAPVTTGTTASSGTDLKGGGALGLNSMGHHGMQAI